MSTDTKIEWADKTWSPTTGCDRVSPGCDNCYALTMSARLKAMGQAKYQTDGRPETSGPGFGVQVHPETLGEPLRWRKPRRVFVDSMSDLFHPDVSDDFLAGVWAVMWLARAHTFQVLTKRPQRARALLSDEGWWENVTGALEDLMRPGDGVGMDPAGPNHPLPNVWLGVSVEDQERADQRIPLLLDTPAAVRFISAEPLLGPVDLRGHLAGHCPEHDFASGFCSQRHHEGVQHLDWVIIGGESGPGARPMDLAWVRSLLAQCRDAGVAPFVKQLGASPYVHEDRPWTGAYDTPWPVTGKGGDPAEWPAVLRVREFPETEVLL